MSGIYRGTGVVVYEARLNRFVLQYLLDSKQKDRQRRPSGAFDRILLPETQPIPRISPYHPTPPDVHIQSIAPTARVMELSASLHFTALTCPRSRCPGSRGHL